MSANTDKTEILRPIGINPKHPIFIKGKFGKEANTLEYMIPDEGKCRKDMPALERWRRFLNLYLDTHKAGSKWRGKLSWALQRFDLDVKDLKNNVYTGITGNDSYDAELDLALLEHLADYVFAEAWYEFTNFRDQGDRA